MTAVDIRSNQKLVIINNIKMSIVCQDLIILMQNYAHTLNKWHIMRPAETHMIYLIITIITLRLRQA